MRIRYQDTQGTAGEVSLEDGESVCAGRALDCAIRTDDISVSRRHVRLTRRGPSLEVQDLGSANGIAVNGSRTDRAVIGAGDRLQAGALRIEVVGAPALPRQALRIDDHAVARQAGAAIIVGKSFAFVPPDLLDQPSLRWLRSLLPDAKGRPRVISLLGTAPIELPGVRIDPVERPPLSAAVVTSDKALYREGADVVNLLVVDPLGPGREVVLDIAANRAAFARRPLALSAHGAGAVALRDLPAGDYTVRLRGASVNDPPCRFTVAEYRLSPLVAALEGQAADGDRLRLTVRLTSFGVPVSGPVQVELRDAGARVERREVDAADGRVEVSFRLTGEGPHTLDFQLVADPGRTATIPLVGSRRAERTDTVFSTLGAQVVGSLLPSEDAREVRGLHLRRAAASTSPVRLDKVETRRPRLTAAADLETVTIVVIDPTVPAHRADAVELDAEPQPGAADEVYRHGERLFGEGRWAAALETFEGARARLDRPHPNYAYWIACCHARAGDVESAMAALRTAIADGWTDADHMRGDEDLAALRDQPGFASLLGGGVVVIERSMKAGETVELDVPAPLAFLAIGTFVDGAPWEGHAAIVAPPRVAAAIAAPATCRPGDQVTIAVETGAAGDASVYLIVKDARLASTDTPSSRLAGQLKAHVEEMRDRALGSGVATRRLTDLIPPPLPPPSAFGGLRAMAVGGMAVGSGGPPGSPMSPAPAGAAMDLMNAMGPMGPPGEEAEAARPTIEEAPEVVFAGLVAAPGGRAVATVELGEAFADYVVEAFVIDGVEWSAATARFRAERAVFAAFDLPPFVHRDDAAIGRLTAGGGAAGMTVEISRDGAPVAITAGGSALARGETVAGPRAEIAFVAGPGDYVARLRDVASGETVEARARVDEPGKLRRLARAVHFLRPGERITRSDDRSILSLRPLPGLDGPFRLLTDATAEYGHACCEQTAAKMLAACAMYTFDPKRRERAEEIVIAGVRRQRLMFLAGRGFRMYPDSGDAPDTYWGPKAARYLWNLELLRDGKPGRALGAAIDDGLAMAADATRAYGLDWPPTRAQTPEDAYGAVRFGSDARVRDQALGTLRQFAVANGGPTAARRQAGTVAFRADAAYAAAGLFRAGGDAAVPIALVLANQVVKDLGSEGRLYSTVDSVAAIALMTELQAAGVVGAGGRVVCDGRPMSVAHAAASAAEYREIAAADSTVAVEIVRTVEDDWESRALKVPVTVSLEHRGRPTLRVKAGDPVDLRVRLDEGYAVGDLVWVALPAALTRVLGGGQVKRFSIDLAGRAEAVIPLAATAPTVGPDGLEAPQHFAVCVRNMFEEERAGSPGLIEVTVTPS